MSDPYAFSDPYVFIGLKDKVHTVYPHCRCVECCPYVKREAYEALLREIEEIRREHFNECQRLINERKYSCYVNDTWYVPVSELKAKESECEMLKVDIKRLRKAAEPLVEAINETSKKTFYPYELRMVHERAIKDWIDAQDFKQK